MLQINDDKTLSTQANENGKNQDVPNSIVGADSDGISRCIKNLSTITKSTRSKKSDLSKVKFAKVNSKTDFLTFKAKKTFIYLQKAFIKAPILRHFDLKYHI